MWILYGGVMNTFNKAIPFIYIILALLIMSNGCGGGRAMRVVSQASDGVVSYDGELCVRTPAGLIIAKSSGDDEIIPIDTIRISGIGKAKLLDYNSRARRIFFTAGDSLFAYDLTSGLMYNLTKGKFSENIECGRSSSEGQFFAFSAAKWNVGKITFHRLIIVDAVEGGIVHYCDSLISSDVFQWIKPHRLGYVKFIYHRGELDTAGMFFDTERNIAISSRDQTTDFLKIPCNTHISPNGEWALEIIAGEPKLKYLLPEKPQMGNP